MNIFYAFCAFCGCSLSSFDPGLGQEFGVHDSSKPPALKQSVWSLISDLWSVTGDLCPLPHWSRTEAGISGASRPEAILHAMIFSIVDLPRDRPILLICHRASQHSMKMDLDVGLTQNRCGNALESNGILLNHRPVAFVFYLRFSR